MASISFMTSAKSLSQKLKTNCQEEDTGLMCHNINHIQRLTDLIKGVFTLGSFKTNVGAIALLVQLIKKLGLGPLSNKVL